MYLLEDAGGVTTRVVRFRRSRYGSLESNKFYPTLLRIASTIIARNSALK